MEAFPWIPGAAINLAVAAVLWWRVGRVESEVLRLRDDRHAFTAEVGRITGSVSTLHDIVVDVFGKRQ